MGVSEPPLRPIQSGQHTLPNLLFKDSFRLVVVGRIARHE